VTVGAIVLAERENVKNGQMWRLMMNPRDQDDFLPSEAALWRAEQLRRTARAAVEDWLEACP
jgi:hypothetical protein